MPFEFPGTLRSLRGIVKRLFPDWTLEDDLVQEAVVHFWVVKSQLPGRTQSWYLQSCEYHLRNYLRSGRSLDSLKHRTAKLTTPDLKSDTPEDDMLLEPLDQVSWREETLAQVAAHDMVSELSRWLSARQKLILNDLADGLGVREIAQRLGISHKAVGRHRRKIAILARKVGIVPPSEENKCRVSESWRTRSGVEVPGVGNGGRNSKAALPERIARQPFSGGVN